MIDPANPDFEYTPAADGRASFGYAPIDWGMPPSISIVTPFYNGSHVFEETARSVLKQSFQQWEWLIINDCSDNSASIAILDAFRGRDPRIKVIDHTENKGLSAARNTGFRAASTPYVVQIDSDDLLEPTAVEKWFWFLETQPESAFVRGYSVGFGAKQYLWSKGFDCGKSFLNKNLVPPTSMIRRAVHQYVGGYDEANREGLEDWEFWLRCANHGHWGSNIPEYLDWYRRRPSHSDRWKNWDDGHRQAKFRSQLRLLYPNLWHGSFPKIQSTPHLPNAVLPNSLPCQNLLAKVRSRMLMVVPWLEVGGADKFNIDLIQQLTDRDWEVTIATTLLGNQPWLSAFSQKTPDVFVLPHFLRLVDYPRFLRYLIQSRNVDVVLITHSQFGYLLLPYLRSHCPTVTFIDFCHIETESWKNGGYPQMGIQSQELLDLNIVSSAHLKSWMINRGANEDRISVCYTNVDTNRWRPDPEQRLAMRKELGLDITLPVILYAGRMCQQKQPRVFAEAMCLLRKRSLPFIALVAGDGPDLRWLRAFINTRKLTDAVRLLGAVSNQRMRQLMATADIYFLPSEWEGIAVSIYEAMATGLPIVGADVGGQKELVTADCGILIARSNEHDEAQQYASALATLIRDPARRAEMGKSGRLRTEADFELDGMADRFISLLHDARLLHSTQPRSVPTSTIGHLCASQAVELTRVEEETRHLLNPHTAGLSTLMYFVTFRTPIVSRIVVFAQELVRLLRRHERTREFCWHTLAIASIVTRRLFGITRPTRWRWP